jgi:hypothetical protein
MAVYTVQFTPSPPEEAPHCGDRPKSCCLMVSHSLRVNTRRHDKTERLQNRPSVVKAEGPTWPKAGALPGCATPRQLKPVEGDPDLLLSHPSSLPSTSASTVKGSFDRIIGMLRIDFNGSHLRNVQPFPRLATGLGFSEVMVFLTSPFSTISGNVCSKGAYRLGARCRDRREVFEVFR